jgi:hypothetical protein
MTAENPYDSFPAATVNGFDEPMFCFLTRQKMPHLVKLNLLDFAID